MKEIKNDVVHIKDRELCLNDLCQVVTVSDDLPLLITSWYDCLGTRQECLKTIEDTDIVPEKGSHFSIVTFKQYTAERSEW